MEDIIQIVKELQTKFNISQADIARHLDIPAKTFNGWLTGRVQCRHKVMLGLALKRLEVKLETFKETY